MEDNGSATEVELPDRFYRYIGRNLTTGTCRELWKDRPEIVDHMVEKWARTERLYRDDGPIIIGRVFYNGCDAENRRHLQNFWEARTLRSL